MKKEYIKRVNAVLAAIESLEEIMPEESMPICVSDAYVNLAKTIEQYYFRTEYIDCFSNHV